MKKILLVCLTTILCFFAINVFADTSTLPLVSQSCEQNGVHYDQATKFVKKLQAALQRKKKSAIADMAKYPVRVNFALPNKDKFDTVHIYVKDKNQFLKLYNQIFTVEFKNDIFEQNPKDIFCNQQGAMIAHGKIWFLTENNQPQFYAVNKL